MDDKETFADSLIRGVSTGLQRFTGQYTRVALMLQTTKDQDIVLYDPEGLFANHLEDLKREFGYDGGWPKTEEEVVDFRHDAFYQSSSDLPYCLVEVKHSQAIFAQRWFCTRYLGLCARAPVRQFLKRASILLEVLYAGRQINPADLHRVFQHDLEFFTFHAVREAVRQVFGQRAEKDILFTVQEVLAAVQRISRSREERKLPSGVIVFVSDPSAVDGLVGFTDKPTLRQHKRILKLLTATDPNEGTKGGVLVSDGSRVMGITQCALKESYLKAVFRRGRGYLFVDDRRICTFQEGVFDARSHQRDHSMLVEELKRTLKPEPSVLRNSTQCKWMAKVLQPIIEAAQSNRHGCSIVIDSKPLDYGYSGELLEIPLSLNRERAHLEMAKRFSRMDGALVVGVDRRLYAAGCILGGLEHKDEEDRAHGARHNSAIRFTILREEAIVVTVSEDGPISIYSKGVNVLLVEEEETSPRRRPMIWRELFDTF